MGRDDDLVASRTQSQADKRHEAGSKGVLYPGYLYESSLAIRNQGKPRGIPNGILSLSVTANGMCGVHLSCDAESLMFGPNNQILRLGFCSRGSLCRQKNTKGKVNVL